MSNKQRKKMAHDFDGKKYQKASSHQKEWGNRLISELNLKGDEKILDLGCGDGVLTQILSTLVPNGFVVGVDASRGMIEVAKEKESKNLKFLLMDIDDLRLEDKYDLIFSNAALHWIKNHQKLYEKLSVILNENGTIRFNFAADGNCSYFFNIINQTIQKEEYRDYFKDFVWPWFMPTLDQYKKILDNFSFSNVKIWEENADRYFPNKEALIGWIEQPSIVPFLEYLPIDKKKPFTNEVIEKMVKATIQDDGRYFETFRRINVLVTK
jgi:trans-aconitate methyltransferase